MTRTCLRGTPFACACERCMEEQLQKAIAHSEHIARLKNGTRHYWTDQYSARDKASTVVILHAGFKHEEGQKAQS